MVYSSYAIFINNYYVFWLAIKLWSSSIFCYNCL